MGNPFCHIELHSNDVAASKKFYSDLLDWKLEDMPMGETTYTMINVGEGTGGGMMQNQGPEGTPSHWMAYILVNNVEETTSKARELGGSIVLEVTAVGDFGKMSIIQDPAGAHIAFWQQLKDM